MKAQLFATFINSGFGVGYHGFLLVFLKHGEELLFSKIWHSWKYVLKTFFLFLFVQVIQISGEDEVSAFLRFWKTAEIYS